MSLNILTRRLTRVLEQTANIIFISLYTEHNFKKRKEKKPVYVYQIHNLYDTLFVEDFNRLHFSIKENVLKRNSINDS